MNCRGCGKLPAHPSHPCICNLTLCLDCYIKTANSRLVSRGERPCEGCNRLPAEANALRAAFSGLVTAAEDDIIGDHRTTGEVRDHGRPREMTRTAEQVREHSRTEGTICGVREGTMRPERTEGTMRQGSGHGPLLLEGAGRSSDVGRPPEGVRPPDPLMDYGVTSPGLLLPVDYTTSENRYRDLRSPPGMESRLVSDPHSRSSGVAGGEQFNSRSAPESRARGVAESSRHEGRGTRQQASDNAMQGGYLYEPVAEPPRYGTPAVSSNESLPGSSRKKCDSTDAESDTSPRGAMNERSKSFSPEASVKKVGPRGSLSQISNKNLRQSKPQSTPGTEHQRALFSSGAVNDAGGAAVGPGGSKSIYSRKFLSLKTLRVQGLPGYALNHARAFEWLGKYGAIEKLVVVDKSPTSVLDVEYATMESARLCILDAHGSIIRTGNGENEFRIRVCPSVVHFCPQYLHGLSCHNPRCIDLHTSETCDWIRALSATASSRQISEVKRDIVRELRAPWKNSKSKPKLLGESEQATYHKLKLHDHAAQIIQYSPVLNQLYTHQSFL